MISCIPAAFMAFSNSAKGGYGLYNINERIKLSYGPNYGITCESTPGHGTTITIKIKKFVLIQKTLPTTVKLKPPLSEVFIFVLPVLVCHL